MDLFTLLVDLLVLGVIVWVVAQATE